MIRDRADPLGEVGASDPGRATARTTRAARDRMAARLASHTASAARGASLRPRGDKLRAAALGAPRRETAHLRRPPRRLVAAGLTAANLPPPDRGAVEATVKKVAAIRAPGRYFLREPVRAEARELTRLADRDARDGDALLAAVRTPRFRRRHSPSARRNPSTRPSPRGSRTRRTPPPPQGRGGRGDGGRRTKTPTTDSTRRRRAPRETSATRGACSSPPRDSGGRCAATRRARRPRVAAPRSSARGTRRTPPRRMRWRTTPPSTRRWRRATAEARRRRELEESSRRGSSGAPSIRLASLAAARGAGAQDGGVQGREGERYAEMAEVAACLERELAAVKRAVRDFAETRRGGAGREGGGPGGKRPRAGGGGGRRGDVRRSERAAPKSRERPKSARTRGPKRCSLHHSTTSSLCDPATVSPTSSRSGTKKPRWTEISLMSDART